MKIKDIYTSLEPEIDISNPDAHYEVILSGDPDDLLADIYSADIWEQYLDINKKDTRWEVFLLQKKEISLSFQQKILQLRKYFQNFSAPSYSIFIPKISQRFTKKNNSPSIKKKRFQTSYSFSGYMKTIRGYYKGIAAILTLFLCIFLYLYTIKILMFSGYSDLYSLKNISFQSQQFVRVSEKVKTKFSWASSLYTPLDYIQNTTLLNGRYLINAAIEINNSIITGINVSNAVAWDIEKWGLESLRITKLISNNSGDIASFMHHVYSSLVWLQKVEGLGDQEKQKTVDSISIKGTDIYAKIDTLYKNLSVFMEIIWEKKEKQYLIVLQNNDEIRPTGGFMGSMAIVTINNGKLLDINFQDVYQLERKIDQTGYRYPEAPNALSELIKRLKFRDANFFTDFSKNSNMIQKQLQEINLNIDAIVYMNQWIILDLLKTTPGIEWSGETITHKNFSELMSILVEAKISKKATLDTPKQTLFHFAEVFIETMKREKKYIEYLNIVYKHMKNRDLFIHSFTPQENSLFWKLWVSGRVEYSQNTDFVYPIFTSIGWNKTDRYIDIEYNKTSVENKNCSIDTNIHISRFHRFSPQDETRITGVLYKYNIPNKKKLLEIQWKADNSSFVRIQLPKIAEIKPSPDYIIESFPYYNEVQFIIRVKPGRTAFQNIAYTINNPECYQIPFVLYKQPGIKKYSINFNKNLYENIYSDFIEQ